MGGKIVDYATDNNRLDRITKRKQEYSNYCEDTYNDIKKNRAAELNMKLEEMGLLDDNTRAL